MNFDPGVTVEFWLKKEAFDITKTEKEVIFDLWNNQLSSSADYGRLTIALTSSTTAGANPFLITAQSGTVGFSEYQPTIASFTTASLADGNWHHYALTIASQSAGIETKIYVDGVKKATDSNGSVGINNVSTINGNISLLGGLVTAPSASYLAHVTGSGKLSGSMDEFRYWKQARTDKQVANTFFIPIGGGTNEFDYNRSLGLYYKFNEGITGTSSIDNKILDYSGRIANGAWTGYTTGARQTTSAMVQSGYARTEFKDPIIYSFHPDVVSTLATLKTTGSVQDNEGTSKMMALLPGWLQEKDQDNYNNQVKKFTQIMASYFDNLNAQIGEVNNIFDEKYPTTTEEPYPFAQKLLESRGFVVPNLFTDGDLVNYLLQKDDNEIFEMNITDVKNRIYHNIYNNLTYILKSKGTEKSFRNLLRCFGIDSEVMRLSLYADDSTYTILDNYEYASVEKKALNLNNRDNLEATIYNTTSSNPSFTYISSSEGDTEQYTAFTVECEAVFPLQLEKFDDGYFPKQFYTASVYGFHRALTSSVADYTWHPDLDTDLKIYAVKPEHESKDVYFVATSSYGGFNLTSSTYFNTYENNKWNFAFRVKNNKYPYTYGLTGSTGDSYYVEFVGYNSEGDTTKNNFSVSASVSSAIGKKFLDSSKRLYAGAHKTNFTGSTLLKSDVAVTDVKYWQSYLDDETIQYHSFNPDNAGTKTPFNPDNVNTSITYHELTDYETLALHWRFDTLTGSDASGEITGFDFSSGSTENASRNSWLGGITGNKYPFKGQNFITSSAKALDRQFLYSAKQRNFGVLMSSDGVTIKNDANTMLFTDDDVSDNFYSFEKSYHGVISQQMLNMFASLIEFNDLIGYPIDGYKKSYKEMEKLARLFFEKMENRVEPEKFFEFYKWIDTSIMYALGQLFPASAKFSETSRNVIESHVLERNKLDRKFPLLIDVSATEGYARGINELFYSWKFGHAPVPQNFATSLKFGKTSSAVRLIDSSTPSYPTTGGFSLAAWIKVEDFGGNATIYTAQNSGSQNSIIFFVNENILSLQVIDTSGNANIYQYSITNVIDWNNWNYVAVSWDGNFANDAEFYVNGVTNITPTTITKLGSGATLRDIDQITIGDASASEVVYITSLAIWNSSLSNNSVGDHYYFGEFNPIENNGQYSDLISYYKFGIDDAAGAVASVTDIISGFDVTKNGSGDLDYVLDSPYSFYGISENENCLWQKHRKERKFTYGKFDATTDRQTLLDNLNSGNNSKHLAKFEQDGTAYAGSTYALRNFGSLHKFSVAMDENIHGGTNYSQNKNRDIVWDATYIHGPVSQQYPKGIPQNVLVVGLGEGQGTEAFIDCVDVEKPNEKRKWRLTTVAGRRSALAQGAATARNSAEDYNAVVKGEIAWPLNLISASVTTGYQAEVVSKFKSDVVLSNIHSDTYAPGNEIGMQGPFTETWVGGHQSRHVDLNKHNIRITTNEANATATLVMTVNPTDGDTITIGDGTTTPITYTFKNTPADPSTQILIDGGGNPLGTMVSLRTRIVDDFNISIPSGLATTKVLTNNNVGIIGNYTLAASFTSGANSITGFAGGVDGVYKTTNNLDAWDTRPEGWRLLLNECSDTALGRQSGSDDGAMGFVGPDYGGPYPDYNRKYAVRYRDERAKRPVNVRNIKTTTDSARAGNFLKNYEVVMIAGKEGNNLAFRDIDLANRQKNQILPDPIWNQVPFTTNYQTLIGYLPGYYGNVWGDARCFDPDFETKRGSNIGNQIFYENNRQVEEASSRIAHGSFYMSGALYIGTRASGSFRAAGLQNFMFNLNTDSDDKFVTFGSDNYRLDTINPPTSNSDPNYYIQTGSNNTDYFNNLRTRINTNSTYSSSYAIVEPIAQTLDFSSSLNIQTASVNRFLGGQTGSLNNLEEVFSFWIDLSGSNYSGSANTGDRKYLLNMSDTSFRLSKELYISLNGDLNFNLGFGTKGRQYKVADFFETHKNSGFINITINNQYPNSAPVDNNTIIYINAVSQSVAISTSGGIISNSRTERNESEGRVDLFNSGSGYLFQGKAASVAFMNSVLNSTQIKQIYNNGYLTRVDKNSSIDSADIVQQYLAQSAYLGNVEATVQLSNGTRWSGSLGDGQPYFTYTAATDTGQDHLFISNQGPPEPTYGAFSVTASAYGSSYNDTIVPQNGTTYTYFTKIEDLTGGIDPTGSVDADTLTFGLNSDTIIFELDSNGSTSGTNIPVSIVLASDALVYNAMSASIKANTSFDTVNITSFGNYALLEITASAGGAGNNGTFTYTPSTGERTSFFSLANPGEGLDAVTYYNIIERNRDDLTSSDSIITTRFSAPGGPEIQSQGYLDVRNTELSAYNAMPFRNLTVRSSGSGESGRIRLNDIHDQRFGLQTHLRRHSGQFGYDSVVGSVTTANDYVAVPSFHKIQRNGMKRLNYSTSETVVTGTIYNNGFYQSCIPQSDFQYAWITGSIGDDLTQRILGFAPAGGYVSSSSGYVDAIVFPSASQILGSL